LEKDVSLEAQITNLIQQWNLLQVTLEARFRNRESKQAVPVMEQAIELFIQYIYMTNEIGSSKSKFWAECDLKPVNLEERLQFIISRPGLFHSYKQLTELFTEQEKQYAKYVALSNLKKRPDYK
jgi:hypothetical protein